MTNDKNEINKLVTGDENLPAQVQTVTMLAHPLRPKSKLRDSTSNEAESSQEYLRTDLNRVTEQLHELQNSLAAERDANLKIHQDLKRLQIAHTEEIRTVRFELGEAQETVAQHELVTEQLASDLVDTRSFKDELENMLTRSEAKNEKLHREVSESRGKIEAKGDAIDCLLAELSKKSEQIDFVGETGDVAARSHDLPSLERDRLTRVLIASIDDQELRFPLFKDRLTIGRTKQNDIQIDASYVSRRHAVVVTDHQCTRVVDWGSKNGVFVNSKRITEHFLKSGDMVTIGTASFRYEERPKRSA
jgi:hypothetical protein